MKLIDINCAIGAPMKSYRYTDAQGLIRWMDDFHIERALAYHSEALREPEMGNEKMIEAAAQSGGRLRACMALNPSLINLGLPGAGTAAQRLNAIRPSAVRIFPEEQRYLFDTFYSEDILELCKQFRMPLIVTTAYTDLFMAQLPEVSRAYPEVPIILPRFGMNMVQRCFPVLKKLPNVYFDISLMVDAAVIEEIVERFGSTNLLFGSGLPTYEPSGELGLLLYSQVSEADKENIAWRNFERLEGGIRYDD